MRKEYIIRKGNKEDITGISEFRKTFFGYSAIRSHEPEYYSWKCYQNPALLGEIWLAEDGDTIVGMKSMTPKKIMILGEVVVGAETGDTFTHPDYQRQGIFTKLFEVAGEIGIDRRMSFIYGAPNRNSLPGYVGKLDYSQIPLKLHNMVKPLVPKQVLEKKLPFPALASLLSPFVQTLSWAMFKINAISAAQADIVVSEVSTFPDDIDDLWQRAIQNYDIMLVRNKEYLEWRYVTNPDTYSIFVARDKKNYILGYLVIKIGFEDDILLGYIADFLTLEHDDNIFKKLLIATLKTLYQRKISLVSTWVTKGSYYERILSRFGFIHRAEIPLICYKNELGSRVLSEAYKWHFVLGDTDNI